MPTGCASSSGVRRHQQEQRATSEPRRKATRTASGECRTRWSRAASSTPLSHLALTSSASAAISMTSSMAVPILEIDDTGRNEKNQHERCRETDRQCSNSQRQKAAKQDVAADRYQQVVEPAPGTASSSITRSASVAAIEKRLGSTNGAPQQQRHMDAEKRDDGECDRAFDGLVGARARVARSASRPALRRYRPASGREPGWRTGVMSAPRQPEERHDGEQESRTHRSWGGRRGTQPRRTACAPPATTESLPAPPRSSRPAALQATGRETRTATRASEVRRPYAGPCEMSPAAGLASGGT